MDFDLPFGFLRVFSSVNKQIIEQNKALFGGLSDQLNALNDVIGKIETPAIDLSKFSATRVIPEGFEWPKIFPDGYLDSLNESFHKSFPKCWPDRIGNIDAAMTIAQDFSFPLVDFPSRASAEKVFDAYHRGDKIDDALIALHDEIIQDFNNRDRAELPIDIRYERPLDEVAECLASGKHMAAQALAFSVLEDLWWHLSEGRNNRRQPFTIFLDKRDYGDDPLHLLKWNIALASSFSAYKSVDFKSEGFPSTVHRHATAHSVSENQYTRTNALKAFVIAVTTASLCAQPGLAFDETKRMFNKKILGLDS